MKQLLKYKLILLMPIIFLVLISCEDAPPSDYIKKYYLEAYIFVGNPIRNIKIMATQPLADSFIYKNSFIKDAEVIITTGNKVFPLKYDFQNNSGYYCDDTTYLIQPLQEYSISVLLKDGSKMNASTNTPDTTSWTYFPNGEYLYYPKDTLNLPEVDSLKISWKAVPNTLLYLASLKCEDTLEYGKYLNPTTIEKNRRIVRPWENPESAEYLEMTRWGFLASNTSPIIWNIFKWFGKSTLKIYIPDINFMKYMIQYQRTGTYDPLLSNIKGEGIGIFASASYIEKKLILIKNQP